MKRLVIVGAGAFGRELAGWVKTSPKFVATHGITQIVFIDDNPSPTVPLPAPVVGTITTYRPLPSDLLLCSVGDPKSRQDICQLLLQRGATFVTFVHDTVLIGGRAMLGAGTIICPQVILSTDINIGDQVHVNAACTVGHDVRIGSFSTLSSNCSLTGYVTVGSGVFLGTAVTIIPGKSIGDRTRIGAGSVVLRKLPADISAFGNPCRQIGKIHQ